MDRKMDKTAEKFLVEWEVADNTVMYAYGYKKWVFNYSKTAIFY